MSQPHEDSTWRKSSFSDVGNCVEVRHRTEGVVEVRNSRNPDGEVLSFTTSEWRAFIAGVEAGEFSW